MRRALLDSIENADKNRLMLLGSGGRRGSANPPPSVTSPPPPPQPTSKSNPMPRKALSTSQTMAVPAPPPPPQPSAKPTKSLNQALEQLLNESVEVVNVDGMDLNDLDITNVDINFEEIEDYQLVKEALLQGVDLRVYSLQVETSLSQVDKESVGDYFAERENFVKLYDQLGNVDVVLGQFEDLLSNFQRDLRSISSEIRNLQTQTMSMNMKLRNRKTVEEKVQKFLEDISTNQELRDHIYNDEVNEKYMKSLITLDKKVSLVNSLKAKGALAVQDVSEGQLGKILARALKNVQKYLFTAVVGFKPSERKQRQQELVHLGYLFQFLFKHSPASANDLVASYVDSCASYYTSFYNKYATAFDRAKDSDATKAEYLTSSSNKFKNVASSKSFKNPLGVTFFSLGGRADVLSQLEQLQEAPASTNLLNMAVNTLAHGPGGGYPSPVSTPSPSAAPQTPTFSGGAYSPQTPPPNASQDLLGASAGVPSTKYPFEVIFKNILLQLMDLVSIESKFVVDFFLAGDDVSLAIFGKCIAIFTEILTHYLTSTADIVGILLILCISHKYLKVMGDRRVTVLDPMFQKQSQAMLVQLVRVFNDNQENLKQATIKELKPIELSPHILTRRFADLLASVSFLLPQLPEDVGRTINANFKNLRLETDKVIQKMADEISDSKNKAAFLIVNYGFIFSVLQERGIKNTDSIAAPTRKIFDRHSAPFIDEQINTHKYFTIMINFVREWAPLVENNVRIDEVNNPKFNKDAVEGILRDFDVNWKLGMEDIKRNLRKAFAASPSTCALLLELILERLHSNYKQLIDIVEKCFKQLQKSSFYRPEQVLNDMRALATM